MMKYQTQIITLRNTIEKIIPVLAHDPLLTGRTQVDYFTFYHNALAGLGDAEIDTAIHSMDKFGYNEILVNNLVEYTKYITNLYKSKEQQILHLSQNIDQIQHDYLDFHYPLVQIADTHELVQLKGYKIEQRKELVAVQTFKNPYPLLKVLIDLTSTAISKYINNVTQRKYISEEKSKELLDILVNHKAFNHDDVDNYEFFNLLNLKPFVMEYDFVSETPKFLLINQIGSQLNKELRKIWINGIIKVLDVNTESFGKNKRRVPKMWKVLNDDLESFRLT